MSDILIPTASPRTSEAQIRGPLAPPLAEADKVP